MLCPKCRRQVGRNDPYCPEGHVARPELLEPPPNRPRPQAQPPVPQEVYAAESSTSPAMPSGTMAPPPPIPAEPMAPASETTQKARSARAVGLVVAALLVGVLGYVTFGRSASAANLKLSFTPGEVLKYSLVMTFDMSAGNHAFGGETFKGSFETVLEQTVRSVDTDGVATIDYRFDDLHMSDGGRTVRVPSTGDALTVKMAPDGRVVDVSGNGLFSLGGDNPIADLSNMFGPESFGPQLPDSHVDPGESWKIDEEIANPFGKPIHFQGTGTLVEQKTIGDEEVAVIHSVIKTPFDFRLGFNDLSDVVGGELPSELKDASMSFTGFVSGDMTQSLGTTSGSLTSALGDLKMTGTMAFENVPQVGSLSAVFNMAFDITMTKLP